MIRLELMPDGDIFMGGYLEQMEIDEARAEKRLGCVWEDIPLAVRQRIRLEAFYKVADKIGLTTEEKEAVGIYVDKIVLGK